MTPLTFAEVASHLPPSKERDEAIELLEKEEPANSYSRRTIFLLIGLALAAPQNSDA